MDLISGSTAALGLAVAAHRTFYLKTLDAEEQSLVVAVRRLCAADNIERAIKLCAAGRDAAFPAMVLAALERAASLEPAMGPREIDAAVQGAFDATLDAHRERVARTRVEALASLGLLAVSIGYEVAQQRAPSAWLLALAAVGVLVVVWGAYLADKIVSRAPEAFAKLRPAITDLVKRRAEDHGPNGNGTVAASTTAAGEGDEDASDAGSIEEPPPRAGALVLDVYEPGQPRRTVALDGPTVKVGRLPSAHLQLEHPSVSLVHATIELAAPGGATLVNHSREYGTSVEGTRVDRVGLRHGDVVFFGDVRVVVGMGAVPPRAVVN